MPSWSARSRQRRPPGSSRSQNTRWRTFWSFSADTVVSPGSACGSIPVPGAADEPYGVDPFPLAQPGDGADPVQRRAVGAQAVHAGRRVGLVAPGAATGGGHSQVPAPLRHGVLVDQPARYGRGGDVARGTRARGVELVDLGGLVLEIGWDVPRRQHRQHPPALVVGDVQPGSVAVHHDEGPPRTGPDPVCGRRERLAAVRYHRYEELARCPPTSSTRPYAPTAYPRPDRGAIYWRRPLRPTFRYTLIPQRQPDETTTETGNGHLVGRQACAASPYPLQLIRMNLATLGVPCVSSAKSR